MIFRLDEPNQAKFSTVSGRQPYFHKWTTPISRIRTADTVYNTRSKGIAATWFPRISSLDANTGTSFAGNVPIVKFWYAGGQPEVFSSSVPEWGVKYSGYFRAPISADYTFLFAGEGELASCLVSSVSRLDVSSNRADLSINNTNYASTQPFSLNADQWTSFVIRYKKSFNNNNSGFITLWKTDSASVTPELVPLSAGVTSPNNIAAPLSTDTPFPVPFSNISSYNDTELTVNDQQTSTFKFTVPFVSTATYNYNGYRYNSTSDAYISLGTDPDIKKYRMIEYSEGFKNSSGVNQYITKFTGQIRDFKISYKKDGNDTLTVVCQDYTVFTNDTINLVSPTPIDYFQVGYTDKILGRVNGKSKPRTFDGWDLHKAYQVLLTESFIDPWTFYKKEVRSDVSDAAISVDWFIEPTVSSVKAFFPVRNHYGNPNVIQSLDINPDDEYLFKIDTGEFYQDAINEILKPWFYKWGFNRFGYPFLKRINIPSKFLEHTQFDHAVSATDFTDLDAFKGTYGRLDNGIGQISSARFTGSRADLIIPVGPTIGDPASGNITVTILDKAYNSIQSTNLTNYYAKNWLFFNGADPLTGINPTINNVARNLKYDEYICRVHRTHLTLKPHIDTLFIYKDDLSNPNHFFKTGDTDTAGSIGSLTVNAPVKDQRTDTIVLGSLTGTKVQNKESINPNNPVLNYIQSAARDLNSVYNSTAKNYVGRPRITVIQDPKINSQDQADFVAFNVTKQFSNPNKPISVTIAGNPTVEVDDLIVITDDYKKGVDTNNFAWVTGVTNRFNAGRFSTQLETSPTKPVESFWSKTEPVNATPVIQNFRMYNRGVISVLDKVLIASSATAWVATASEWIPTKGFINLASAVADASGLDCIPNIGNCKTIKNELVKYTGVIDNGDRTSRLTGLSRDLRGTGSIRTWVAGSYVNAAWDPYTSETMGVVPYVTFDVTKNGSIEVQVIADEDHNSVNIVANSLVDALTDVSGETHPDIALEPVTWGTGKLYRWGGMDNNPRGDFTRSISNTDIELDFGVYVNNTHIWEESTNTPIVKRNIVASKFRPENQNKIWIAPYLEDFNPEVEPLSYSKFFVQIRFIPDDGSGQVLFSSKDSVSTASFFFNRDTKMYSHFYTHLGDRPTVDFYFDTAGMSWYDFQNKKLHSLSTNTARDYPEVVTDATAWPHNPVFIESNSNDGQGLKCWIHQADTVIGREPTLVKDLSLQAFNWNVRNYTYITYIRKGEVFLSEADDLDILPVRTFSGNVREHLGKDEDYTNYRNRKSFFFNLKNATFSDQNISALTPEDKDRFEQFKDFHKDGINHTISFSSQIFFSGSIVDRSGRAVIDARVFEPIWKVPVLSKIDNYSSLAPENTLNVSGRDSINIRQDNTLQLFPQFHKIYWRYTSSKPFNTVYNNLDRDGGMTNHGWYRNIEEDVGEENWQYKTLYLGDLGTFTNEAKPKFSNVFPESGNIRLSYFGDDVSLNSTTQQRELRFFRYSHNEKSSYVYWIDNKTVGDVKLGINPFNLALVSTPGPTLVDEWRKDSQGHFEAGHFSAEQIGYVLQKGSLGDRDRPKQRLVQNWAYPIVMFGKR